MKTKQTIMAIAYNKKGDILSIGRNQYDKSHPKQAFFAKKVKRPKAIYLHAEIDALIRAKTDVHKLHVIRVMPNGSYGLAKPCNICELALKHYGVKVITHT